MIGHAAHPVRRVLMTADAVGGVWTYALELCAALRSFGIEVVLATMGPRPNAAQREAARALLSVRVVESDYRLEWMNDPWAEVAAAGDWLLSLERRLRPDVVHLNGYVHAALAWRAPTLVVGHSCVCSWYEAVRGAAPPPQFARYRDAVQAGLRAADAVTAPSSAMLEALHRHYGEFASVGPIHNARCAHRYARGCREPLVLAVGRVWDEGKNLALLDQVAPHLPWPIAVAGSVAGPDGGGVTCRNLRLLGMLDESEMAAWYGRAAVFAAPARYEPFGLAALEAGLSGCALVLGDIPSLREVWGDAALFVAPDDADGWSAALRSLCQDAGRCAEYGERAQRRARTFLPERMGAAYARVYMDLVQRGRRPHGGSLAACGGGGRTVGG